MAIKLSMATVWEWRRAILNGYTVQQIASSNLSRGYSETTIYNYTKQERAKVKQKQVEEQTISDLFYANLAMQEEQQRRMQEAWDRGDYNAFS